MDGDQLTNALYGEADRAEFELALGWNTRPPPRATATLERGLTAGLVTLCCFIWTAVLLAAAGWLADLLWAGRPWSLLLYGAVALGAAAWVGLRYARRPTSAGHHGRPEQRGRVRAAPPRRRRWRGGKRG